MVHNNPLVNPVHLPGLNPSCILPSWNSGGSPPPSGQAQSHHSATTKTSGCYLHCLQWNQGNILPLFHINCTQPRTGSWGAKMICASIPTTSRAAQTPMYVVLFQLECCSLRSWIFDPKTIEPDASCQTLQWNHFLWLQYRAYYFLHLILTSLTQRILHKLSPV